MRKVSLLFIVTVLALSLLAQPVQAAGNPFQNFSNQVRSRFQKVMLWLPGAKDGRLILQQSSEAMQPVTSATMTVESQSDVTGVDDQKKLSALFRVSGPFVMTEPFKTDSIKQDLNLSGELTMEGTSMKANVDVKVDGKTTYFKVNEVPVLPFMDLSKIKGEWLKTTSPEVTTDENMRVTESSAEDQARFVEAWTELVQASRVSQTKAERIDGQSVWVVEISLPDEALVAFYQKTNKGVDQTEEIMRTLDIFDEFKAKVTVAKRDYRVKTIELPYHGDLTKLANTSTSSVTPVGDVREMKAVDGTLKLDFAKYNEPVAVEIPASARELEAVMGEMMGGTGAMMPATTPKITRPSELPELSAQEKAMLKQYGVEVEDL